MMKLATVPWLMLTLIGTPSPAAERERSTIEVYGVGETRVPSDVVLLGMSIVVERGAVEQAKEENDRIAAMVFELAESQGLVEPHLISTEMRFDFHRESREDKRNTQQGKQKAPREDPFKDTEPQAPPVHMSRQLNVKFLKLSQAIEFLREVEQWKEVKETRELQLYPLKFDVEDRSRPLLVARQLAIENAKERAVQLAAPAEVQLGAVLQMVDGEREPRGGRGLALSDDPFGGPDERSVEPPTPYSVPKVADQTHEERVDQLPPQQLTVRATVKVVFELVAP